MRMTLFTPESLSGHLYAKSPETNKKAREFVVTKVVTRAALHPSFSITEGHESHRTASLESRASRCSPRYPAERTGRRISSVFGF
jgi:hypothetical protein